MQPGTRLGPYEITAQIGAGGMGEVFRALDTNLGRQVAIKILPDTFAHDPERLARFEREAKTLASLNHPYIAQIYGFENSDGIRALVMELVEGPTLADRISQGPITVDEALPIARQIAEALEAAHEQGIIHRDLKPANIKLRPDGVVKVLDFGLAKALEPMTARVDATASPTITSPAMMTGVGVLLGTAAYMSPEQARGKAVDKRSDIWALGCVLYEMLTGQRAFGGEDVTETLAAVVKSEPAWGALPDGMSPSVRVFLQQCLQKNPKQRLHDIADMRLALAGAFDAATSEGWRIRPVGWRRALIPVGIAIISAVVVGGAVWFSMRSEPPRVVRLELTTTGPQALSIQGLNPDIAITSDGSRIVYVGQNQLLVRPLDQLEPTPLTGLGTPRGPFVSPDGEWIGFFDGTTLKKVAITGGPPVAVTLVDGTGPRGATWGDDGRIVFATATPQTGLQQVSAGGGKPVVLTRPNPESGEFDHLWPEFLPGGQAILYTIVPFSGGFDTAQIAVLDLRTNTQTVLVRGGSHAHYVNSGHVVYGAGGTLRAVAFDLERLAVVGTSVPVLDQVLTTSVGAVDAVMAHNGTLVYVSGTREDLRQLTWFGRDGKSQGLASEQLSAMRNFTLAPDESRVAIQISPAGVGGGLWITDLTRRVTSLLVSEGGDPTWSPDGTHVAFAAGGGTIFSVPSGGGKQERLFESENDEIRTYVEDWHPDGEHLAVLLVGERGYQGAVVATRGSRVPVVFDEATRLDEPHFSPDGKWIAYNADRDGRGMEVYLVPYPPTGERIQVSAKGGGQARWRADGHELFYLTPEGTMMAVEVSAQGGPRLGVPVPLFDTGLSSDVAFNLDQYAVTRDGRRFLLAVAVQGEGRVQPPRMVVVENWTEELKRRVPVN